MHRPWTEDVVQTVSLVFKHLFSDDEAHLDVAKQALHSDRCGSVCELQASCLAGVFLLSLLL